MRTVKPSEGCECDPPTVDESVIQISWVIEGDAYEQGPVGRSDGNDVARLHSVECFVSAILDRVLGRRRVLLWCCDRTRRGSGMGRVKHPAAFDFCRLCGGMLVAAVASRGMTLQSRMAGRVMRMAA